MHTALRYYTYYRGGGALPESFAISEFSHTTGGYAHTSSRQTDLEIGLAPFSLSGIVIPSNNGLYLHRIIGVGRLTGSEAQYTLQMNNPGGTIESGHARLRLVLFKDASNYIFIETEELLKRNRPCKFVVTWDGVNAAGLDMYINGVKETSPTRTTVGTFNALYSNTGLRFIIGRDTSDTFRGNVRDVALWDKQLSEAEALELYDESGAADVAGVSFYGDVVSYWPLTEDAASAQNANYNLATTSGLTYTTKRVNSDSVNVYFKKATITNARYVAFGGLVKISDTLAYWIGRSGTNHLAGGKLVKIAIHLDTQVIDAPVDIITDGSYDLRGGNAGIIGDKIFVLSSRYDAGTFIDLRYWQSTDGLTGEAYDSGTVVDTDLTGFNAYGEIVSGFSEGEYFIPFHEGQDPDHNIYLYKTVDSGDNFTKVSVYIGELYINESALVNLGNDTLLMIVRSNESGFGLYSIVSTDGGDTWAAPVKTNLGSSGGASCACLCVTSDGKLNVTFMDRGGEYLWVSKDNVIADIIADPTAYNSPTRLANSYAADSLDILGYPCQVLLPDDTFLTTYHAESASGVADLYVGFGEMDNG